MTDTPLISVPALDSANAPRNLAFIDTGNAVLASVHAFADATGTLTSPATEDTVATITPALAQLHTDNGSIETALALLHTDAGVIETAIGIVSTDVAQLHTDNGAIETVLGTVSTGVAQLHTDLGATETALGQIHTDLTALQLPASGVTPVIGTFAETGDHSADFIPLAGRDFNFSISGTFSGTIQVTRKMPGDSDALYRQITVLGSALYVWTAPCSESLHEDQVGVAYRAECVSLVSGTPKYRFEQ